jgi:hypothetical protein
MAPVTPFGDSGGLDRKYSLPGTDPKKEDTNEQDQSATEGLINDLRNQSRTPSTKE